MAQGAAGGAVPVRCEPAPDFGYTDDPEETPLKNLVMLSYPDGGLEASRELLGDIVRAIRTYRPYTASSTGRRSGVSSPADRPTGRPVNAVPAVRIT